MCGSQQTVENFSGDGNTRLTLPASWEICVQVEKQQFGHGKIDWLKIEKRV